MDIKLFDYDLPREMIAQEKSDPRDDSRLFMIDASSSPAGHSHHRFRDLPDLMDEGDLLVLNRSRVIPARIEVTKETGGRGEVLLLKMAGENTWEALVGGRRIGTGDRLATADPALSIVVRERLIEGKCMVALEDKGAPLSHAEALKWLRSWGLMPTPPYIKRLLEDPEEYQTVYGKVEGSVAAPTAGLHFTDGLLECLGRKGVVIRYVVLHVGLGTFSPVKVSDVTEHIMEEEEFLIPDDTIGSIKEAVERTRSDGKGRIWAVGTTVMRTLETGFDRDGNCVKDTGSSGIFITPGYDFKLPYKGFITNFHLPRSTPLMLASAFHDREGILDAYEEAKKKGYRFYSLGDSMMIRRS